jgi:hypothetical protein
VDSLLVEKYESTRQVDEYRQYARVCEYVKNSLEGLDLLADQAGPLFESEGGRGNWEVYLSGLRRLFRDMPHSYLFRFVLPMFGLEDLREQLVAYSVKWLDQTHAAHRYFREADRYLSSFKQGIETAEDFGSKDKSLVRLYASLKTWETQPELNSFVSDLEEFLSSSVEVFIAGPIQLYLMLSRDTMTMIFKTLSVGKLSELTGAQRDVSELTKFSDFIHGTVEKSSTLEVTREVIARAVKEYVQDFREEQARVRAQLPSRTMREEFVQRFEAGVLFQRD